MYKYVPIILAILAIVALGYLFMNNDMSSNQPSQTMRNIPMHSGVENFAVKRTAPNSMMANGANNANNANSMYEDEDEDDVNSEKPSMKQRPSMTQRTSTTKGALKKKGPMTTKYYEEEPFVNAPQQQTVSGSEEIQYIAQPQSIGQTDTGSQMNQLPSECYPKDVLSSVDLLPRDANSLWAQVNPSGQGSLADQNFLTSGFHIGINTVGQTLRNANRQLRSEPLNPQVKVSPWMQTTIDPDINRRPLEISSGDL